MDPQILWEQLKNAASQGDIATIKSVLKAKVLPNPDVPGETTPLMLAAYSGQEKAIPLLVKANAHIDASSSDNGWTALMHAAANDKTRVMKVLVEARASLDHRGSDGNTALILAAQKGYKAAVKLLVDAGANVCAADNSGRRALSWAVSEGHLAVVKTLVKADLSLDSHPDDGAELLTLAARKGNVDIAHALINKKNAQSIAVAKSAMATAAREGALDVMKCLIEAKAPSHQQADSQYCNSLMQLAAANGHWGIIQYLLRINAKKKGFYFDQYDACMTAARNGHVSVVIPLTEGLYTSNRNTWYDTEELFLRALDAAAVAGQCRVLSALIDGMDVYKLWDPDRGILRRKSTPLISAAQGGHVEAVEFLIKEGFSPDETDWDGNTPLNTALANGHVDVLMALVPEITELNAILLDAAGGSSSQEVKVLLEADADVNTRDRFTGNTPLMLTVQCRYTDWSLQIMKVLLDYGADVDMRNNQGQTALILAACADKVDVFRELLNSEADVTVRDNNGQTALMWLAVHGRADLINNILSSKLYYLQGNEHVEE